MVGTLTAIFIAKYFRVGDGTAGDGGDTQNRRRPWPRKAPTADGRNIALAFQKFLRRLDSSAGREAPGTAKRLPPADGVFNRNGPLAVRRPLPRHASRQMVHAATTCCGGQGMMEVGAAG